jgi:SAM-dependent methyltransferase
MVDRARSFGSVAAAYDRFRPDYPAALVDLVLTFARQPVRTAFEIGAGTGKATRLFAQRGIAVTATDPDAEMLAELVKRVPTTVKIVQASFEEFPLNRTYDLVYAAAAMHWTDPKDRWRRVAALLEPGGTFASFGNPIQLADPVLEEAMFAAQAPFLKMADLIPPNLPAADRTMQWPGMELTESEWFTDVEEITVRRRFAMTASAYIDQLSTVSAYVVLPASSQEQVWERIRQVLPERVDVLADTTAHLARRAG